MALRESKPDYDTYFSDPALVKGYYIPTEPLKLTEKQRMLAMSPCKIPERESGDKQPITPETAAYLRQSDYVYDTDHVMPTHPTPSPPSTVKFDESWPSTDKPSTLSGQRSLHGETTLDQSETLKSQSPGTDDSVISKYLRRFRQDPPRRREDRKAPSLSEFWWGSNKRHNSHVSRGQPSDHSSQILPQRSSTRLRYLPADRTVSSTHATENTSSGRDLEVSSDTTPKSSGSQKAGKRISFMPETPKTKALMDRTNELLTQSDLSAAESSPPVSSGGVGQSSVSPSSTESGGSGSQRRGGDVYHSTPEEEAVRPILHRHANRDIRAGFLSKESSYLNKSRDKAEMNPENDILYQWRLKRRMEQAQQKVQNAENTARYAAIQRRAGYGIAEPRSSKPAVTVPHHRPVSTQADQEPTHPFHPTFRDTNTCSPPRPPCGEGEDKPSVAPSHVPSKVERLVQTDAELNQATTQTTPTVDPISECTGSITTIPTQTLRERIAARSPERELPSQSGYDGDLSSPDRQQPHCTCCHQRKHCCPSKSSHPTREDTGHTSTSGHQGEPESETKRMPSQSPQKQSTPTHAGSKVRQIRHRRSVTNVANRERRSTSNEQTTPVSAAVHEVAAQRLFDQIDTSDTTLHEPDTPESSPAPDGGRVLQTTDETETANTSLEKHDSSDGEFPDDDLLRALREKRELLLVKIQ